MVPGIPRLTILGGFDARLASGASVELPTRKSRALLAYLTAHGGRRVSRETLTGLLWADQTDAQGRRNLRHSLWELRRAFGSDQRAVVGADTLCVWIDTTALESDVIAFERAIHTATPESYGHAAILYRGEFLAGFSLKEEPFQEWVTAARMRFRTHVLHALERVLDHQTAAGATEQAVVTARRVLALDPLREPVHRALMRLHLAMNQRSAAMRQYQVCADVLERELGLAPDRETERVRRDVHAQAARSEGSSPTVAVRPGARGHERLVGRSEQLDRLLTRVTDAQRGASAVVAVIGDAGIGKSHLMAELAREARHRGAHVLLGHCHDGEQVLPLGPWLEALADVLPGASETRRGTAPLERRQRFDVLTESLAELARARPIVVILEDLHWADDMSMHLLAFAARRLARSRVLIVVTLRAEELGEAPLIERVLGSLAATLPVERLALGALSREETATLVRALVAKGSPPADTEALSERAWTASEGHPLMAVEVVRAGGETAPRIHALAVSRLERLSAPSRRLASVAAVIGSAAPFKVLQRIAGVSEARAVAAVEELVRRRVLEPEGDRLRFTHPRVRDAAYAAILLPLRAHLHAAVTRALASKN